MIILDTQVVLEPMRAKGDPAVTAWLDRQAEQALYLTAISLAELPIGIEILPDGKRRQGLDAALAELVAKLFGTRVLTFDQQAAMACAPLIGRARAAGHAISVADGQIAAIASVHGFTVATRDSAPFVATGVPVVNPWQA